MIQVEMQLFEVKMKMFNHPTCGHLPSPIFSVLEILRMSGSFEELLFSSRWPWEREEGAQRRAKPEEKLIPVPCLPLCAAEKQGDVHISTCGCGCGFGDMCSIGNPCLSFVMTNSKGDISSGLNF